MIRTVPCKKKNIENLVVYNNTDRLRNFECTLEQDDKKVRFFFSFFLIKFGNINKKKKNIV